MRSIPYLLVSGVVVLVAILVAVRWMVVNRLGEFNPTADGLSLVLLTLRLRAVTGASLLGAIGLLGLASLVWILAHLRQVRLHQNALPLRQWGVLPPYGLAREFFRDVGLAAPIDNLLRRVEGVWPTPRTMLIMGSFDVFACILARKLVIFDHLWLGAERALPYVFVGLLGLLAWGCARAWRIWQDLKSLLAIAAILPVGNAFERLPRRLLEVFRRPLSNETEQVWRSYWVQLGAQMSMDWPRDELSTAELSRIVGAQEAERLRDGWGAPLRRTMSSSDKLQELWGELVGLKMIAFLGYVRAHVFNGIGTVTAATLPLLWLTSMYPFQSSRVLLALALVLVLASVGVTLVVLTQMNRNEILSRIEGTDPGKVTWDFSFVSGLLIHGALPVVALVSLKFPAMGRTITDWLFALLKGVGGT